CSLIRCWLDHTGVVSFTAAPPAEPPASPAGTGPSLARASSVRGGSYPGELSGVATSWARTLLPDSSRLGGPGVCNPCSSMAPHDEITTAEPLRERPARCRLDPEL